MHKALELLKLCMERFPPVDETTHVLSIDEEGKLHLCISIDETFFDYRLDEVDMDKEPEDIVKDVSVVMGLVQDTTQTDCDHKLN
jgi:hypothetical protein